MDFAWSAEEETFRGEIRAFLQAELPEGWGLTQFWDPDDDAQFAFAHEFTKKLGRKNWLAVSWPQEYGGLDWPFWKQFIYPSPYKNQVFQWVRCAESGRIGHLVAQKRNPGATTCNPL